jgi:hypothetical protein
MQSTYINAGPLSHNSRRLGARAKHLPELCAFIPLIYQNNLRWRALMLLQNTAPRLCDFCEAVDIRLWYLVALPNVKNMPRVDHKEKARVQALRCFFCLIKVF